MPTDRRPRLLNCEPGGYSPAAKALLELVAELRFVECDRPTLLREVRDAEILMVRLRHRIDAAVLAEGRSLRFVVSATTGLSHIDLDTCAARRVTVLSLQGETAFLRGVTATAELAWALVLAVMRRVPAADEHVRKGGWDRDLFRGRSLSGRTLGVVGLGRLGEQVARYGQAFGMGVVACDPYRTYFPGGVKSVELRELVAEADVISLHVPLNRETERLIDSSVLSGVRPGAILVNTSRGEVVDDHALVEALTEGRLAGAGLDVLRGEDSKDDSWLQRSPIWTYAQGRPEVVLTPHIGGAATDAMEKTEVFMARKLVLALSTPG